MKRCDLSPGPLPAGGEINNRRIQDGFLWMSEKIREKIIFIVKA